MRNSWLCVRSRLRVMSTYFCSSASSTLACGLASEGLPRGLLILSFASCDFTIWRSRIFLSCTLSVFLMSSWRRRLVMMRDPICISGFRLHRVTLRGVARNSISRVRLCSLPLSSLTALCLPASSLSCAIYDSDSLRAALLPRSSSARRSLNTLAG